ncbi:hypothetical protein AHAS_Ahas11G0189100 [Arachis hypogaea]
MPMFIRRGDLIPEAKGWYEIVWRSILPSVNTSEVNIKRATMVHCIMTGGEIRVHELIAKNIQEILEKSDPGSWLYYPSTILRLCKKSKVVFEDVDPDWLNPGKPITPQRLSYVTAAQSEKASKEEEKGGTTSSNTSHYGHKPNTRSYRWSI